MMSTLTLVVLVAVAGVIMILPNSAEAKMAKGLSRKNNQGCSGWSNSGAQSGRKKCRKPWDRKSSRDGDVDDDREYGNGDGGEYP